MMGNGNELLVVFLYHAKTNGYSIFFRSELKGTIQDFRDWNILEAKKALRDLICTNILFIHVIFGFE